MSNLYITFALLNTEIVVNGFTDIKDSFTQAFPSAKGTGKWGAWLHGWYLIEFNDRVTVILG